MLGSRKSGVRTRSAPYIYITRVDVLSRARKVQKEKEYLIYLRYNIIENIVNAEEEEDLFHFGLILEEVTFDIAIINLLLRAYQEYLNLLSRI